MELTEQHRKIFASAEANEGRHLVPKRWRKYNDMSPPDDLDREYQACDDLVSAGYAQWLNGNSAPGIRLTGKPLDAD
jgi:hypothetical protein